MPIVSLAVRSTTLSPRDLTTLVDKQVKRRLENISGVGQGRPGRASRTREIAVDLDPDRLEALGMGVDEVIAGLRSRERGHAARAARRRAATSSRSASRARRRRWTAFGR